MTRRRVLESRQNESIRSERARERERFISSRIKLAADGDGVTSKSFSPFNNAETRRHHRRIWVRFSKRPRPDPVQGTTNVKLNDSTAGVRRSPSGRPIAEIVNAFSWMRSGGEGDFLKSSSVTKRKRELWADHILIDQISNLFVSR